MCTNGGALPEVVGDAGLIVQAGDGNALATAIRRMLQQPDLREEYASRARVRVSQFYTWDKIAKDYTRYYYNVKSNNEARFAHN